MSFLNIKDPKKRDAIVSEYLATVQRLKKRNISERLNDFAKNEIIQLNAEPVVQSANESTTAITKELIPIKEQITALNNNMSTKKDEEVMDNEDSIGPANFLERIYHMVGEDKLDRYFGIVKDKKGQYRMGDKIVHIDGSDIVVENQRYEMTQGLWNLVMMRSPANTYTTEDIRNYRDLVEETNAMYSPNNVTAQSKIKNTTKWLRIFPLFDNLNSDLEWMSKDGEGLVKFLPGDIKGLEAKLRYLLAEFRTGNTTTREEIVPITDELLRRNKITQQEYKTLNNLIQQ